MPNGRSSTLDKRYNDSGRNGNKTESKDKVGETSLPFKWAG